MNLKNCLKCGAPINKDQNKCSYCGVSYFDMSFLDLQQEEPFYLTLKLKGGMVLTQLVKPSASINIDISSESIYATSGLGQTRKTVFHTEPVVNVCMEFESVRQPNGTLMEMRMDKSKCG